MKPIIVAKKKSHFRRPYFLGKRRLFLYGLTIGISVYNCFNTDWYSMMVYTDWYNHDSIYVLIGMMVYRLIGILIGTIVYTDWKNIILLYILISATVCYNPFCSWVVFHPPVYAANNRGVGGQLCGRYHDASHDIGPSFETYAGTKR